jgi:hypothetical protein
MHFEIRDDVNEQLLGLAWLLGTWVGNGHGTWPDTGDFEYGQQIEFTQNGGPYIYYFSQTWFLDAEGQPEKPLLTETGYWLPHDDATVDAVLAHPEGIAELWSGKVQGAKIELTTDVVVRVPDSTLAYTGGQRLYGNVDGDLLWTWDRGTEEIPLQPFMWAKLQRQG